MFRTRLQFAFHLCRVYLNNHSPQPQNTIFNKPIHFAPYLYKNETIELSKLSRLLYTYFQKHLLPFYKPLLLFRNHSSLALRTYLHQQYDATTSNVPQLFRSTFREQPYAHTLSVQCVSPSSSFEITVPSLSEDHIRYTIANHLCQTADTLSLIVYEKERQVRCIINESYTLPLQFVFLTIDGQPLLHIPITMKADVPITLTRFALVHHPRVRRWLYTQNETYPYLTFFVHTQLFTKPSLSRHTHLQANDTVYCIMTTETQQMTMHRQIDIWVDTLDLHHNATLKYMYRVRNKMYTENYHHVPHTRPYKLSYLHQYLWVHWVHQLAFLYKLFHLRKTRQLKQWLNLHCTLLVNSLWNDYAYHTNRVFDNCAKQELLYETHKWKYTVDHWDVIQLAFTTPRILHTMTVDYHKHTHQPNGGTNLIC